MVDIVAYRKMEHFPKYISPTFTSFLFSFFFFVEFDAWSFLVVASVFSYMLWGYMVFF